MSATEQGRGLSAASASRRSTVGVPVPLSVDRSPSPDDVTVVTVTHNSVHRLPAFLAQFAASGIGVLVVDSGSDDPAAHQRIATDAGARFLSLADNVGYGTANNRGVDTVTTPWVCVMNPDVDASPGDIRELISFATHSRSTLVAPRLLDSHGREALNAHPLPRIARWRYRASLRHSRPAPITVSGCCMVVRTADYRELRGFDEDFFLFCEEIDLHLRMALEGRPVTVHPDVKVVTDGGGSSSGVSSRWSLVERDVAHVQFTAKHGGLALGGLDLMYRIARALLLPSYRPRRQSILHLAGGVSRGRRTR